MPRITNNGFEHSAGGGFVVTPVNKGTQSVVRHMLAIDWKFWKLYLRPSSSRSITIRMLERVAGMWQTSKFCHLCCLVTLVITGILQAFTIFSFSQLFGNCLEPKVEIPPLNL